MADSAILTLRLDQHLRNRLDKLAKPTKRLRSFLAAEAIREYVALNARQIEEVRKGIAEANRGEFATPRRGRSLEKEMDAPCASDGFATRSTTSKQKSRSSPKKTLPREFSGVYCFGKFSLKKRSALSPITARISAALNPS
jgi:RHH-type transcriptional regulator, rel operon repressor / antitoxin RelB